ncbi:hypothetical protein KFK09_003676 [Dendrobium nobile]|uniref:Secreted protein n=1 Tax=Dendrobium nobile TaxID=94219 RepID=A0A8T3C1Y5_DENNO|nr:hypothetical protein KFK09_003676 [Dendrobium nobile]
MSTNLSSLYLSLLLFSHAPFLMSEHINTREPNKITQRAAALQKIRKKFVQPISERYGTNLERCGAQAFDLHHCNTIPIPLLRSALYHLALERSRTQRASIHSVGALW